MKFRIFLLALAATFSSSALFAQDTLRPPIKVYRTWDRDTLFCRSIEFDLTSGEKPKMVMGPGRLTKDNSDHWQWCAHFEPGNIKKLHTIKYSIPIADGERKEEEIWIDTRAPLQIDYSRGLKADTAEPEPLDEMSTVLTYPELAKRAGLEGQVVVAGLVDTTGYVEAVEVKYVENRVFLGAAIQAIAFMRFQPGFVHGKPAKLWFVVPLNFKLIRK